MQISVIIPVYNRPRQVKAAAESVLQQQLPRNCRLELLLLDDGSTDHTPEALKELAQRYGSLVRPFFLPHCGYPGALRNRGVQEARGEVIAFLDSDDLWLPEKLLRQLQHWQKEPDCPLIHCREIWRRRGKIISQKKMKHCRRGDIFADALEKCTIGPSTVLMQKQSFMQLGGFAEDLEIAEDYEFWLRLTCQAQIAYLEEPLIIKQAGDWPQLSEKYGQIEIFRIEALKRLVEQNYFLQYSSREKQQQACSELARKSRIYSQGCLKRGKKEEARRYALLAQTNQGLSSTPSI